MRKHLYMLLDKYVLKKHVYHTIRSHNIEDCETMWDVFRRHNYEVYKILTVGFFDAKFYFIVRRKL